MKEEKKNASLEASVGSGAAKHSPADVNYNIEQDVVKDLIEENDRIQSLISQLPDDYLLVEYSSNWNKMITNSIKRGGNKKLEALMTPIKTIDYQTLLEKEFPPLPWIIFDYLPPGLTFLSGKPKIGKSWLALQLAFSVLTGGKIFGKDSRKGKVLYLALEDSERRLQGRMKLQGFNANENRNDFEFLLFDEFFNSLGSLNGDGGYRLLSKIEEEKYNLVIVDTFSRAFDGDQLDASVMTKAISPLQQEALKRDFSLLLVDHMRKSAGLNPDPVIDVFGSVAKGGVTDTAWALYKEQGRHGAKLSISGRDVDSLELQLTFKIPGYFWYCEGDAYEVNLTEERKNILEALEDLGEADNRRVSEYIKRNESNTRKKLKDLVDDGLVESFKKGKSSFNYYRLVED